MTHDEAVRVLTGLVIQDAHGVAWCSEIQIEALDIAIACMEKHKNKELADVGDTNVGNITVMERDRTNTATQFDERVAKAEMNADCYTNDFGSGLRASLPLIKDMQAHIRKIEEELLNWREVGSYVALFLKTNCTEANPKWNREI